MTDDETPTGWGSLVGGAMTFWLGISLYIAHTDLNIGGALGAVFHAGGIFFAGVGIILMVAGLIRILVRMGFLPSRRRASLALEPVAEAAGEP